tara:strand:+ start:1388 stop:2044 length:657 start_codon:yes stop_codon:yes gene_type:complete
MLCRSCVYCGGPLELGQINNNYCSVACKYNNAYDGNKNPFKVHSKEGYKEHMLSMSEHYVDPDVLAQAEHYVDCAKDINGGYHSGIVEDIQEIDLIISEELGGKGRSKFEKRAGAKWSGRFYWDVKYVRNYRREKFKLPKLPSISSSNLEKQHYENILRRQGKLTTPKEQFIDEQKIQEQQKAFTTITPFKTKSGKTPAEILDIVALKKLEKKAIGGN